MLGSAPDVFGFCHQDKNIAHKYTYLKEEFREISELVFSHITFFSAEGNGILRN